MTKKKQRNFKAVKRYVIMFCRFPENILYKTDGWYNTRKEAENRAIEMKEELEDADYDSLYRITRHDELYVVETSMIFDEGHSNEKAKRYNFPL